jgi:hypothetical protein
MYASVADPDPDPDPPDPHVFRPPGIYHNKDRAFWFPCLPSSLCLTSVRLLTPPPPLPLAGSVTIYAKTIDSALFLVLTSIVLTVVSVVSFFSLQLVKIEARMKFYSSIGLISKQNKRTVLAYNLSRSKRKQIWSEVR